MKPICLHLLRQLGADRAVEHALNVIVAREDEGQADHAALGFAEIGELGHAADVHAGAGAELHCLDNLARLPEAAVGKQLDIERRRPRVHVVGEDPGKHLMLGADDVIGARVIDADDLLLGGKRAPC